MKPFKCAQKCVQARLKMLSTKICLQIIYIYIYIYINRTCNEIEPNQTELKTTHRVLLPLTWEDLSHLLKGHCTKDKKLLKMYRFLSTRIDGRNSSWKTEEEEELVGSVMWKKRELKERKKRREE